MKKLQDHWKEQEMTTITLSLDELRRRETALDRVTRRRNMMEYLAGGAATVFLLIMAALTFSRAGAPVDFVMAGGFGTLAAGLLLVGCYLFRSSRPVETDLATSGRDHLGRRLERERRLLATAWLWYVGPMVPGFVLIYVGYWMSNPENPIFPTVAGGLTLAFLIVVVMVNRYAARKIEREIRALRD